MEGERKYTRSTTKQDFPFKTKHPSPSSLASMQLVPGDDRAVRDICFGVWRKHIRRFYLCLTTKFSLCTAKEIKGNYDPKTPQSVEDSLNENAQPGFLD